MGFSVRTLEQSCPLCSRKISPSKVRDSKEEQIADVAGLVVARHVHDFFANLAIKGILRRLELSGVTFQDMPALKVNQTHVGKTFVLTGMLSDFTLEEAKEAIEARGGRGSSSVSQKTDYVVSGANPGSKYRNAGRLEIKIIDESEFAKLIR